MMKRGVYSSYTSTARPQTAQIGGVLFTIIVVVAVLHFAQAVLMPLALAVLLAFLLAPIVNMLQRAGGSRAIAVALTTIVSFALLAGLLYVVAHQFLGLVEDLPLYRDNLRAKIGMLSGPASSGLEQSAATLKELGEELQKATPGKVDTPRVAMVQIVEPPPNAMQVMRGVFGPLIAPAGTAAIVAVFVIFMLLQREDLRDRLVRLLGARQMHTTVLALDDAAQRVSRYLLWQTLINSIQGALVTPQERFYQRLLADDPEEAQEVIEETRREQTLLEVCDAIVFPALRFIEQDYDRGAIDEVKRRALVELIGEFVDELREADEPKREAGSEAPVTPRQVDFKVLCLPAADQADEVAAELFVKLVEVQGIEASAASISALKSEMLDRVEEAQPNMVCISATPPAAVIHARYLCKKLHARFPRFRSSSPCGTRRATWKRRATD